MNFRKIPFSLDTKFMFVYIALHDVYVCIRTWALLISFYRFRVQIVRSFIGGGDLIIQAQEIAAMFQLWFLSENCIALIIKTILYIWDHMFNDSLVCAHRSSCPESCVCVQESDWCNCYYILLEPNTNVSLSIWSSGYFKLDQNINVRAPTISCRSFKWTLVW